MRVRSRRVNKNEQRKNVKAWLTKKIENMSSRLNFKESFEMHVHVEGLIGKQTGTASHGHITAYPVGGGFWK
jgi:hypothetical protein